MKFAFNINYFLGFVALLFIEVLIAIFLKTGFIRHTFGDYLVVILLYCFFKSFIEGKPIRIALFVLCIAYTVELLQLTNYLLHFNLQHSKAAGLILGSTFSFSDMLAYTLGILTVIIPQFLPYFSVQLLNTSKRSEN
ncbi:MAG: DUF2809 domain-containing protein [Flavobacterium sp.]